MLTETLSGKCPCCGYDKLLQRYGSIGYYQLDGCPNCGFGYSSNHHDDDTFGEEAWISYAIHVLSMVSSEGDETYEVRLKELSELSNEEVRKLIFEWTETQERSDDIKDTVFQYTDEDVLKHKEFNLKVFKTIES